MQLVVSPGMWSRFAALLCGLFLVIAIVGCSTDGKGGDVTGVVKLDGKIVTSGEVTFQGRKGAAAGMINSDGSYKVTKPPIGECDVIVSRAPPGAEGAQGQDLNTVDPKKAAPLGAKIEPFPIPVKYSNFKTSGLKHTVTGSSTTYNIDLTEK